MLIAKEISLKLAGKVILNKINLTLSPGKILAIIGPNGAGKTTLLKCLSGEIKKAHRHITINNKKLGEYSVKELAKIRATLPQFISLEFPFLASEIVAMACTEINPDEQWIEQQLCRFGAKHLINRNYLTLSGGEQKRVQLARVVAQLSHQANSLLTQYLLLDECTASLDPAHQQQTFREISSMTKHSNLAVVMILHDLHLAAQYADEIVLMKEGNIVQQGCAEAVLQPEILSDTYHCVMQIIKHPQGWLLAVPA